MPGTVDQFADRAAAESLRPLMRLTQALILATAVSACTSYQHLGIAPSPPEVRTASSAYVLEIEMPEPREEPIEENWDPYDVVKRLTGLPVVPPMAGPLSYRSEIPFDTATRLARRGFWQLCLDDYLVELNSNIRDAYGIMAPVAVEVTAGRVEFGSPLYYVKFIGPSIAISGYDSGTWETLRFRAKVYLASDGSVELRLFMIDASHVRYNIYGLPPDPTLFVNMPDDSVVRLEEVQNLVFSLISDCSLLGFYLGK
jgi:hypothetical protein